MAHYVYSASKLVDSVEIGPHNDAKIVCRAQASQAELIALRQKITALGCSALADMVDGKPVIEVRGLNKPKALLACLSSEGECTLNGSDRSIGSALKGSPLLLSAILYDIGNAAFFVSGIQRGRHNKGGKFTSNDISEILIGGAFSIGDLLMTFFGKPKGDEPFRTVAKGLQSTIDVPAESGASQAFGLQQSPRSKMGEWLHEHVVQIKCASEFLGGAFTVHSALKPGNRNYAKLTAGILIGTGWLSTLLLDKTPSEKLFADKKDPEGLRAKIVDNPRAYLAKPLALLNNVSNLWGALSPYNGERVRNKRLVEQVSGADLPWARARQHDYSWNVVSAVSFLGANSLFGKSGGYRDKDDEKGEEATNDMVLLAANMLAQKGPAISEKDIHASADYIAKIRYVKRDHDTLSNQIRNKYQELNQSGWAGRVAANDAENTVRALG